MPAAAPFLPESAGELVLRKEVDNMKNQTESWPVSCKPHTRLYMQLHAQLFLANTLLREGQVTLEIRLTVRLRS